MALQPAQRIHAALATVRPVAAVAAQATCCQACRGCIACRQMRRAHCPLARSPPFKLTASQSADGALRVRDVEGSGRLCAVGQYHPAAAAPRAFCLWPTAPAQRRAAVRASRWGSRSSPRSISVTGVDTVSRNVPNRVAMNAPAASSKHPASWQHGHSATIHASQAPARQCLPRPLPGKLERPSLQSGLGEACCFPLSAYPVQLTPFSCAAAFVAWKGKREDTSGLDEACCFQLAPFSCVLASVCTQEGGSEKLRLAPAVWFPGSRVLLLENFQLSAAKSGGCKRN